MIDVQNMCYCCMEKTVNGVCTKCGFDNNSYSASQHQLKPGTILNGKYVLGRCIGEGGFGITYVGYDLNLNMKVAIKEHFPNGLVVRDINSSDSVAVYSKGSLDQYNLGKDKFIKEAQALAKCQNLPGVVSVKDFFNENGTAYIVMEFIEGDSFKNYLKRNGGKLEPEKVKKMIKPLIEALIQVHNHKIIHRDISPDNIMVTDSGEMKLIDFGAAREVTPDAQKSLSIMLKPGYAPEEQYRTHGKQGPWTDVYALCATIYRAVTGITPLESLERLMNDTIQLPSELSIDISYNFESVIMKGMSVERELRYQSMTSLYNALYQPGSEDSSPPPPPPLPPQRSNVGLNIVLGIVIMLLIGVLTFITMMILIPPLIPPIDPPVPTETIVDEQTPVFDKVTASSTRGVDTSTGVANYYPIEYINDGDLSTAWSSNRNIEITPTVTFSADEEQYVTGIKLTNGYVKSTETYYYNRRITKVEISHDEGKEIFKLKADAYRELQNLRLKEPVDTKKISIHVLDSAYGKWKDIAISEVEFY